VKSRLLEGPSLTNHIGTHNMDKPPSSHSIIGKMDSIYMYEATGVSLYSDPFVELCADAAGWKSRNISGDTSYETHYPCHPLMLGV